jgi:hypothetical protein
MGICGFRRHILLYFEHNEDLQKLPKCSDTFDLRGCSRLITECKSAVTIKSIHHRFISSQIPFPAITFNNELLMEFEFRILVMRYGMFTPSVEQAREFLKDKADE